MAYTKRILCLANSNKYSKKQGGRCIAGREVTQNGFGDWIRPVSARQTQEINRLERRYSNGGQASVLDYMNITFMDVPAQNSQLHPYQAENHLIDGRLWSRVGRAKWEDIQDAVDTISGPLWHNGKCTFHGENDSVPENTANKIDYSLMLIRPENARVRVKDESQYKGRDKRKIRADFKYSRCKYILSITDIDILEKYKSYDEGLYPLNDALFCLSLGEIYRGSAYKLVASIITPDMG